MGWKSSVCAALEESQGPGGAWRDHVGKGAAQELQHGREPSILIIQGHPDVTEDHLGHALAHAYAGAATAAGHQVRTATPAQLDFPLLRSQENRC